MSKPKVRDLLKARREVDEYKEALKAASASLEHLESEFVTTYGEGIHHDPSGATFSILKTSRSNTSRSWKSIAKKFKDEMLSLLKTKLEKYLPKRNQELKGSIIIKNIEEIINTIPVIFDEKLDQYTTTSTSSGFEIDTDIKEAE